MIIFFAVNGGHVPGKRHVIFHNQRLAAFLNQTLPTRRVIDYLTVVDPRFFKRGVTNSKGGYEKLLFG